MNMRLLGARTLKEVVPEMVDASNIHNHVVAVPGDRLYDANCEFATIIGSNEVIVTSRHRRGSAKREAAGDPGEGEVIDVYHVGALLRDIALLLPGVWNYTLDPKACKLCEREGVRVT